MVNVRRLYIIFYGILFSSFFWIFLNIILNHQEIGGMNSSFFNPFLVSFAALLFIAAIYCIHRIFIRRFITDKVNFYIFCSLAILCMLVFQILCAYSFRLQTGKQLLDTADIGHIVFAAEIFASGGSTDDWMFFLFPYQNMAMLILALFYKIAVLFDASSPFNLSSICLNIFLIDMSVIVTVLLLKDIYGYGTAAIGMLFAILFSPFYLYAHYYYTDTLSILYPVLILFLFYKMRSKGLYSYRKCLVYAFLIGIVAFIGSSVKMTVLISLIAVTLALAVGVLLRKRGGGAWYLGIFVLVPVIIIYSGNRLTDGFLDYLSESGIGFTYKQAETRQVPKSYFMAMGLNSERYGAWYQDDAAALFTHTSYGERNEYFKNLIKERLKNYGAGGYIKFLTKKLAWIWGDGTFYGSLILGVSYVKKSFLHSVMLYGSKYYRCFAYYSQCIWVGILFFILIAIRSGIKKELFEIENAVLITLSGVLIFSAVWESQSRYLLNYAPVFIFIAAMGFHKFAEDIDKVLGRYLKSK